MCGVSCDLLVAPLRNYRGGGGFSWGVYFAWEISCFKLTANFTTQIRVDIKQAHRRTESAQESHAVSEESHGLNCRTLLHMRTRTCMCGALCDLRAASSISWNLLETFGNFWQSSGNVWKRLRNFSKRLEPHEAWL